MMKKLFFELFPVLFLTVIFSGCGPSIVVNGQRYYILTPREEEMLVGQARHYMRRNTPKIVAIDENDVISKETPELKIEYYGDKRGKAEISWQLPERKLTVVIIGEFFTRDIQCVLQEVKKVPDVIDFRPADEPSKIMNPNMKLPPRLN